MLWRSVWGTSEMRFASFCENIHHLSMRFRALFVGLILGTTAWAGIVDDVRTALAQNNFAAAESELTSYRNGRGVTSEYLEAYSWMARAAFDQRQYDQAAAYAKQTKDAGG